MIFYSDGKKVREKLDLDLESLNKGLETSTPQQILKWVINQFEDQIVILSLLSNSAIVNIVYREIDYKLAPVIFLDTLHHFRETIEAVQVAAFLYNSNLKVYKPYVSKTLAEFEVLHGQALWQRDVDAFHQISKVEPLNRALRDLNAAAWITGRRRDQSSTRRSMSILELDQRGLLKINSLANWGKTMLWNYIVENHVPYNLLLDKGYASIGDKPLTTSTLNGEHERAGRWRGTQRTERGIHA